MTLSKQNSNNLAMPRQEQITRLPDAWLTTHQLAYLLQISPSTLEKARSLGKGTFASVPYHKLGRSVRYRRSDIQTFLDSVKIAGSRLRKLEG